MSGGVDSSVAAALMVRQGHEVIGVTLQIWQESQTDPRHSGCCSLGAVEDARRVARLLDISHYVLNFKQAFRRAVIDNFVDEYMRGRTPNPCVQCNKEIKFDLLAEKMREFGCERLVTGHYARIRRDPKGERFKLMQAKAKDKDQSYVLFMLSDEQLAMSEFPMGELASKEQARTMARELGLPVADKPDSQEICFVSEAGGYREFLRSMRPDSFRGGQIVDSHGTALAEHEGVADFTVGQRRGLRVASGDGKPLYVLRIEPSSQRVVVGPSEDLRAREVVLEDAVLREIRPGDPPMKVRAKIRYNMEPQAATIFPDPIPRLVFTKPVRAVTPGQFAVAYRGKTVVAGGTIVSAGK